MGYANGQTRQTHADSNILHLSGSEVKIGLHVSHLLGPLQHIVNLSMALI